MINEIRSMTQKINHPSKRERSQKLKVSVGTVNHVINNFIKIKQQKRAGCISCHKIHLEQKKAVIAAVSINMLVEVGKILRQLMEQCSILVAAVIIEEFAKCRMEKTSLMNLCSSSEIILLQTSWYGLECVPESIKLFFLLAGSPK